MYFVVLSPGYYGDKTFVRSSHKSVSLAWKAAKRGGASLFTVRMGDKKIGDEWLRTYEQIYPIVPPLKRGK